MRNNNKKNSQKEYSTIVLIMFVVVLILAMTGAYSVVHTETLVVDDTSTTIQVDVDDKTTELPAYNTELEDLILTNINKTYNAPDYSLLAYCSFTVWSSGANNDITRGLVRVADYQVIKDKSTIVSAFLPIFDNELYTSRKAIAFKQYQNEIGEKAAYAIMKNDLLMEIAKRWSKCYKFGF